VFVLIAVHVGGYATDVSPSLPTVVAEAEAILLPEIKLLPGTGTALPMTDFNQHIPGPAPKATPT